MQASDDESAPSWSDDNDGHSSEDDRDDSHEGRDDLGLADMGGDGGDDDAFEVLSPEEIIEKQQQALARVVQVLPAMPVSTCRILLQHFKWDASKLLAEYTAAPGRLREKLGLPREEDVECARGDDTGQCLICLEDEEELMGVECGHKFCLVCWRDYLHGEVRLKHKVILCPGRECSKVLDELTVIAYLDDEETKNRFRATLVQSFVDDNPLVRWCPAANCTNAVVLHEVLETHNEAVTCTCGVSFCFRCGVESDHRPNSCRMFGEWRKKQGGGDTSLNDQLIATISRQCPKCNTSIQKNGGCNHMKVTRGKCTLCAYHFCWQCMNKFGSGPKGGPDGYNTHRCNRPYEDDNAVMLKKEELQRFYWHGDRYNNHARSLALEQKLLANASDVVSALCREKGLSQQACKYYVNALKQLVANRHLLMQSYVFGYFRPLYAKAVNREIFENLQLDLELHTEKLSHLLEDSSPAHIHGAQQALLHMTQVARNVYNGLMDSANEWTSAGDVASPPLSPSLTHAGAAPGSGVLTRNRDVTEVQARFSGRRKGSAFFKKLFKRETAPAAAAATTAAAAAGLVNTNRPGGAINVLNNNNNNNTNNNNNAAAGTTTSANVASALGEEFEL